MSENGEQNPLLEAGEMMVSLRTTLGLSLENAAARAHLDAERLAEAEAGEVALSEPELQALADAYEVGITAFFGGRTTPINYLFGV